MSDILNSWELSKLYNDGELHIEHVGYIWIICDRRGFNVVRYPGGIIGFDTNEDAIKICNELNRLILLNKAPIQK